VFLAAMKLKLNSFYDQFNNNKIPDLRALEPQLKNMASLETIYLEGNPCQQTEGASYRRKIMLALPQVKQIDATFVFFAFIYFYGVPADVFYSFAKSL
jgi:hypothetical protein